MNSNFFRHLATKTSYAVGTPAAFLIAASVILIWGTTGPVFHFSDTWQLVINTSTTIITFLMVFLIQNTQNRDSKALHIKVDELLRAVKGARTSLVDIEELEDEELEVLQQEFRQIHERYSSALAKRRAKQHNNP